MWTVYSENRLLKWQAFRRALSLLIFEDAVKEASHLWSYAPMTTKFASFSVQPMPNPWELILKSRYNDFEKAYGIITTLYFTTHGTEHKFELRGVKVNSNLEPYNLVVIDEGKYILNYVFDTVVSNEQLEKDYEVLYTYSDSTLCLNKY